MDLEARLRYPQRTYGEKVVMIAPPMPDAQARAQVAAMDKHIHALEARLGRPATGTVHWVRGPLLGREGAAIIGLCLGSRPGEAPDAEGLSSLDRHEVAHCVLTSHCNTWMDPPALLTEGWAYANQDDDAVMEADRLREDWARHTRLSLRQLTGPDWYDLHDGPVYTHGAALVDFLIDHFGPAKFVELYTTCRPTTFESDCRRILGLDLDAAGCRLPRRCRTARERGWLARSRLARTAAAGAGRQSVRLEGVPRPLFRLGVPDDGALPSRPVEDLRTKIDV